MCVYSAIRERSCLAAGASARTLDEDSGCVRHRVPLPDLPDAVPPRFHAGAAHLVVDGTLHAIDLATGELRWSRAVEAALSAPLVVHAGHLYAIERWTASSPNRLVGFDAATGEPRSATVVASTDREFPSGPWLVDGGSQWLILASRAVLAYAKSP